MELRKILRTYDASMVKYVLDTTAKKEKEGEAISIPSNIDNKVTGSTRVILNINKNESHNKKLSRI